jgi:hypothetical protein
MGANYSNPITSFVDEPTGEDYLERMKASHGQQRRSARDSARLDFLGRTYGNFSVHAYSEADGVTFRLEWWDGEWEFALNRILKTREAARFASEWPDAKTRVRKVRVTVEEV